MILDLNKAFDTVSHNKLIHKLKAFGINSQLLAWIQEWLLNRSFYVLVNGCSSPPTNVTTGVHQGLVLGSLLFLLYINDLPKALDCDKTSVRLFADDAILYRPINVLTDCQLLQNQLCRVTGWAEEWQLVFNTNICTASSMFLARTQFTYYSSGNIALASTETFTYIIQRTY